LTEQTSSPSSSHSHEGHPTSAIEHFKQITFVAMTVTWNFKSVYKIENPEIFHQEIRPFTLLCVASINRLVLEYYFYLTCESIFD
jgi:hypothetical protein